MAPGGDHSHERLKTMKNIEKYPNTKDAMEAYNKLNSRELFETWLELEFEEPREPSLLEAAEAVIDEWYYPYKNVTSNDLGDKIVELKKAIEREKRKPVRNCDKYKTAEEACDDFTKMCKGNICNICHLHYCGTNCQFAWLYEDAGKEETK